MRMGAMSVSSALVFCGLLFGCGPNLESPSGGRVSLHEYDRVGLKRVEVTTKLPNAGLSTQLATSVSGRLHCSGAWSPPNNLSPRRGQRPPPQKQADLIVTILHASNPDKPARVLLGWQFSMTCRVEVRDHETSTVLGSAVVYAAQGPPSGGMIPAGVTGVMMNLATDNEQVDKMLLVHEMANEIVKVLERAKRYEPPAAPSPAVARSNA